MSLKVLEENFSEDIRSRRNHGDERPEYRSQNLWYSFRTPRVSLEKKRLVSKQSAKLAKHHYLVPNSTSSSYLTSGASEKRNSLWTNFCYKRCERRSGKSKGLQGVHSQPVASLLSVKPLDCYNNKDCGSSSACWKSCCSRLKNRKTTVTPGMNPKIEKKALTTVLHPEQQFFEQNATLLTNSAQTGVTKKTCSNELLPWEQCQSTSTGTNQVTERGTWNAKSKVRTLQFQQSMPSDLQENFCNELGIHGNARELSKAWEFQNYSKNHEDIKFPREEINTVRNSPELQCADAFTPSTVRRLNRVVLSFSEPKMRRHRARRMQCPCLHYT